MTRAFDAFLDRYAIRGGHKFHGFAGYEDDRNYRGPMIWSEGDCQFQLALELERQFPDMVHVETPIARFNARPWDKETDRRQFIDIVVSDLSAFDVERDIFAAHQHALFVEVKYVGHSSSFVHKSLQTIRSGVSNDLERLKRNLERPRCTVAAMHSVRSPSTPNSLASPTPTPHGNVSSPAGSNCRSGTFLLHEKRGRARKLLGMTTGEQAGASSPLDRRYFGIAIDGGGEPLVTAARTTVEAAVRDVWELPYPAGEAGWCIFSIEHGDEEIRVEQVSDTPVTDEVDEAARRIVEGEATEEDWRFFSGDESLPDDAE